MQDECGKLKYDVEISKGLDCPGWLGCRACPLGTYDDRCNET